MSGILKLSAVTSNIGSVEGRGKVLTAWDKLIRSRPLTRNYHSSVSIRLENTWRGRGL